MSYLARAEGLGKYDNQWWLKVLILGLHQLRCSAGFKLPSTASQNSKHGAIVPATSPHKKQLVIETAILLLMSNYSSPMLHKMSTGMANAKNMTLVINQTTHLPVRLLVTANWYVTRIRHAYMWHLHRNK